MNNLELLRSEAEFAGQVWEFSYDANTDRYIIRECNAGIEVSISGFELMKMRLQRKVKGE